MKYQIKTRPKIPRNRYGYLGANSTGSGNVSSSSSSQVIGGNLSLDTHSFWGNDYNGTQDVNGDIHSPNIFNEGLISTESMSSGTIENSRDILTGGLTVGNDTYLMGTSHTANILPNNNNLWDLGADNLRWKKVYSVDMDNQGDLYTKNLHVTGKATFFELVIDKIRSVGGAAMFTPADGFTIDMIQTIGDSFIIDGMKPRTTDEVEPSNPIIDQPVGPVVPVSRYYVMTDEDIANRSYQMYSKRLLWRATDSDGMTRDNMWQVDDQALCMSFNRAKTGVSHQVSNKYYWGLVKRSSGNNPIEIDGIMYHYIELDLTIYDGTLEPEIGDSIVQCGYRGTDDPDRQSALYISAYDSLDSGLTAPFLAQYSGINDFSLASHRRSYFDARSAEFVGDFRVSSGQSIEDYITQEIEQSSLPLNTYTKYTTELPNPTTTLYDEDSDQMKYVGISVTTDTTAPTDYTKYSWLPKGVTGKDGKDGITIEVNPATVVFKADADGHVIVNRSTGDNYVPFTFTAFRGNTSLSKQMLLSTWEGYNIGGIRKVNTVEGSNTYYITSLASYIDQDGNTIQPTTGWVKFEWLIEGIIYTVFVTFNVNTISYISNIEITNRQFRTDFAEYRDGVATQLSTIQQTANSASIKVDDLTDGLMGTGIDITNNRIKLTTDNFEIDNNSGKKTVGVDANGRLIAFGTDKGAETPRIIIDPDDQSIRMRWWDSQQEGTDPDGYNFILENHGYGSIIRLWGNGSNSSISGNTIACGSVTMDGESGSISAHDIDVQSLDVTNVANLPDTYIGGVLQLDVNNVPWVPMDGGAVDLSSSQYRSLPYGQIYYVNWFGGKVLMIK